MAWRKSPPELVAFFTGLIAERPLLEPRKMFGYPAAFMNGKMAAGLFEDTMLLRLAPDDAIAFTKLGATVFEPMPGRKMTGFMTVPAAMMTDRKKLMPWLERAIANSAALAAAPAKKPKKPGARLKRSAPRR